MGIYVYTKLNFSLTAIVPVNFITQPFYNIVYSLHIVHVHTDKIKVLVHTCTSACIHECVWYDSSILRSYNI